MSNAMGWRRRWPRLVALMMVLAMVLVACGGADDPDPAADGEAVDDDPGDDDGADEEAADDGADDAPSGEPVHGGELVQGEISEIRGLDPLNLGTAVVGGVIAYAIYDPLMSWNQEGEVEPYLAESVESDDAVTWTLTLPTGVEFHDGTVLDADAVEYNLQRQMDPEWGTRHQGGTIAAAQEIDSVEAIDDTTVEITLNGPWSAFPTVLASTGLGLIGSPDAMEELGDEFDTNPVGTGPFEFVEWVRDTRFVAERNDNYWQDDLPYLDRLEVRPIPDDDAKFLALRSDDIDSAQTAEYSSILEFDEEEGFTGYGEIAAGGQITIFNTENEPFDDVRVRRAIAMATDNEALAETAFDEAPPLTDPLPDFSPWYVETDYPEYDPDRARELMDEYLEEIGEDRLELTYTCVGIPLMIRAGELVQIMWEQIGIDIEIDTMELQAWSQTVVEGNFDFACFSVTPFADPDPRLYDQFMEGSRSNYSNYSPPEMQEALQTGRESVDPDERFEAYAEVQRLLGEDVPYLWWASPVYGNVAKSEIQGMWLNIDGVWRPGEVWIEE